MSSYDVKGAHPPELALPCLPNNTNNTTNKIIYTGRDTIESVNVCYIDNYKRISINTSSSGIDLFYFTDREYVLMDLNQDRVLASETVFTIQDYLSSL